MFGEPEMENDGPVGPQNRILDGDLETLGLQSTLKMLALGGKTGVLIVQTSSSRLNIFLQDGAITRLEDPSTPDPDLFDLFRAMGRISADQAMLMPQDARKDLAATTQYMVNNGLLSPAEELRRREFLVTQALSRAIRWERGRFEFRRDISMMRRTGGMYTPSAGQPMNVDHVLLEALRLADERDHLSRRPLPRFACTRKTPIEMDDPRLADLSPEVHWVYTLCDERRPVYAIAFALLMPEPVAGAHMASLMEQGLLDLVDHRIEEDMSQDLTQTLLRNRGALENLSRQTPERMMMDLALILGGFINDLLSHHARYSRATRSSSDTALPETLRRIERMLTPMVERATRAFPRMEGLIGIDRGQLTFADIKGLNKVVRGSELTICYWDAARLMRGLVREVFDAVRADELGPSQGVRQFDEVWNSLLRNIDFDMRRLHQWYAYQMGAQQARG